MVGWRVQRTGLVGRVLEDHVALLVLVLAQRDEDDVAVVDPDLLPQLAADQAETLDAVKALWQSVSALPARVRWRGAARLTIASSLPFPSILRTCAYS